MKAAAPDRFVLDASVAVAWCFEDESTSRTDRLLAALGSGGEAAVPPLWPYEISNAILAAERRKRLTQAQSGLFLASMAQLKIVVDTSPATRVFERVTDEARAHGLTVYDAAYLELCIRRDLPLATLDDKLSKAARAIGVRLV
jgi:predicted nucleic acid-binding protein